MKLGYWADRRAPADPTGGAVVPSSLAFPAPLHQRALPRLNFSNISGLVSRPPLQPFCSGARGQQVTWGTAAGQERKPLVHPCPALPIPLGSHPSLRRQESAAPRLLCQQGIPLLGKREPRKPKLSPKSQASRSAGAVRAPGCRINRLDRCQAAFMHLLPATSRWRWRGCFPTPLRADSL